MLDIRIGENLDTLIYKLNFGINPLVLPSDL